MAFSKDTISVASLVGLKIYAAKSVNTYIYNTNLPKWLKYGYLYKKYKAGDLIGLCTSYHFSPKVINKKEDLIVLFFTAPNGKKYGLRLLGGEISTKKILDQGVKTEGQKQAETKKKYDKTPFEGFKETVKETASSLTKNIIPIVLLAGIIIFISNKPESNYARI